MSAPWEKYQDQNGPWSKYQETESDAGYETANITDITPKQQAALDEAEKNSRPTVWEALNKPLMNLTVNGLMPPGAGAVQDLILNKIASKGGKTGKAAEIVLGAKSGAGDLISGATSPLGIATIPLSVAKLPTAITKVAMVGLAVPMAFGVPESARQSGEATVSGTSEDATRKLFGLGANVMFPALMAGGVAKTTPEPPIRVLPPGGSKPPMLPELQQRAVDAGLVQSAKALDPVATPSAVEPPAVLVRPPIVTEPSTIAVEELKAPEVDPVWKKNTYRYLNSGDQSAFLSEQEFSVPVKKIEQGDSVVADESLIEKYSKGEKLPPIIVENIEGQLTVVDGNHRIDAAKKAGLKEINVKQVNYPSDAHSVSQLSQPEVVAEVSTPPPLPTIDGTTGKTSIKNAQVDLERSQRGLEPMMAPLRKGWEEVWDETMKKIDSDPTVQDRLIEELKGKTRSLSTSENFMLLHRRVELRNEFDKAARETSRLVDEGLYKTESELQTQYWSDRLSELEDVTKKSGTEQGRGLAARKAMMNEDYTLASLETQKRASNGFRQLTSEERAGLKKVADEYRQKSESLERRIAELETKPPYIHPSILNTAEKIVLRLEQRAETASARLRERLNRMNVGLDPAVLLDMAEIGAAKIARASLTFAEWSAAMLKDFGPKVEPFLARAYEASKKLVDNDYSQIKGPQAEKVRDVLKSYKARTQKRIEELQGKLESGDFTKKTRQPVDISKDNEAMRLKSELEQIKEQWSKELYLDQQKNRPTDKKILDGIQKTRGAFVNIVSSFDFSAYRQVLPTLLSSVTRLVTNPVTAPGMLYRPFKKMFQAFADEQKSRIMEQQIKNRPNAVNGVDKVTDIEYTDLSSQKFTKHEENAHSILDEWAQLPLRTGNAIKSTATFIPKVLSRGIRMSNRAFATLTNATKAELLDELLRVNFKDRAPTDLQLKVIGNLVNVATGRGKLSPVTARVTAEVLWAPKLLASRVQALTGQPLWTGKWAGSGKARMIVAKEYARAIMGGYLLYQVSKLFDDRKETSPTSSDFGKITRGETRVDLWGGLQQVTVLAARTISATTTSLKGETKSIGSDKKYGEKSIWYVWSDFVRSKLRPDVGAFVDVSTRSDFIGQPTTAGSVAESLLVPLSIRDIGQIMKEHGFTEAMILEALSQFGAGVSHYESREKQK